MTNIPNAHQVAYATLRLIFERLLDKKKHDAAYARTLPSDGHIFVKPSEYFNMAVPDSSLIIAIPKNTYGMIFPSYFFKFRIFSSDLLTGKKRRPQETNLVAFAFI